MIIEGGKTYICDKCGLVEQREFHPAGWLYFGGCGPGVLLCGVCRNSAIGLALAEASVNSSVGESSLRAEYEQLDKRADSMRCELERCRGMLRNCEIGFSVQTAAIDRELAKGDADA